MSRAETTALWTQTDAAEFLGVRPRTLAQWRWQKSGPPFIRIGRLIRYSPNDVQAWAENAAVRP